MPLSIPIVTFATTYTTLHVEEALSDLLSYMYKEPSFIMQYLTYVQSMQRLSACSNTQSAVTA